MKYLSFLVGLLLFAACNGKQQQTVEEQQPAPVFEMITVPTMITDPEQRAEYLAKHYWDKFDFRDTNFIHHSKEVEQAIVNYVDVLSRISPEVASTTIKDMMKKAEADSSMFVLIGNLYEKYLYEPNSPLRNEDLYIPVLEATLASPVLDDINKIRPEHLLNLAKKNRVGMPAANFTYTLENGQKGTLYGVKSEYVLLYFFNPDCSACKDITAQLSQSPILAELMRTKELKILAVYPDEDLTAFKTHLPDMPQEWIISYDKTVTLKQDEVYDLKAIPTLYLLDKNKKVLLKDVTVPQIEESLIMNIMR